ncbi:GntR family transcriptional regulator [Streptomyces hirsutus]
MQHTPPPAPLYQRVFGVIYQRIRLGDYPAGEALPTEDRLVAEFSVSKATIRKAVDELIARGLVFRRQGKGTFVYGDAEEKIGSVFRGSLLDLISGTPRMPLHDVGVEIGSSSRLGPRDPRHRPGDRQRRLEPAYRRRHGVRRPRPIIWPRRSSTSHGIPRLRTDGLLAVLHSDGVAMEGAEQRVSAQSADTEVARHLETELGAPVLFSQRILSSADGPIDVLHSWYRGDLYEWRSRLDIRSDGGVVMVPEEATPCTPDNAGTRESALFSRLLERVCGLDAAFSGDFDDVFDGPVPGVRIRGVKEI